MKTILYFILGIILGIFAIDFAIGAVIALVHIALVSAIIDGALAYVCYVLAKGCFNKI